PARSRGSRGVPPTPTTSLRGGLSEVGPGAVVRRGRGAVLLLVPRECRLQPGREVLEVRRECLLHPVLTALRSDACLFLVELLLERLRFVRVQAHEEPRGCSPVARPPAHTSLGPGLPGDGVGPRPERLGDDGTSGRLCDLTGGAGGRRCAGPGYAGEQRRARVGRVDVEVPALLLVDDVLAEAHPAQEGGAADPGG